MKIYSIKSKLLVLVALSIVLLGVMITIGLVSYSRIQNIQDISIAENKQATDENMKNVDHTLLMRKHIREVLSAIQNARIAEKAYLQFKQPEYIEQLAIHIKSARDNLDFLANQNISTDEMLTLIDSYDNDFNTIVDLTGKIEDLNLTILNEFTALNKLIDEATKKVMGIKFNAQMLGEDLSPVEANFEALLKQVSSTINFVSAQRAQFQLYGDPAFIDDIMTYYKKKMKAEISAISQSGISLKDDAYISVGKAYKEIMPVVKEQTEETQTYFDQIKETGNRLNEYGNSLAEVGRDLLAALMAKTQQAQEKSLKKLEENKVKADKAIASTKRNTVILSISVLTIGIVAFLTIAFIIMHSMLKPINRTLALLQDIAQGEGDLTKRLTISSRDEIGEMANWFNVFIEKLQKIIQSIANNTTSLTSSAGELSDVSSQMATATTKMTEESTSVAAAGEQLSSNINTVASGAEEMSSTINTVAAAVEEMGSSITEVARNCEKESSLAGKANTQASQTRECMRKLGIAADEIGKVIEVINRIADQTNLLALNATIEAASAGEAGKGFAVVANEVKELAKQSAEATEQIAQQINEMQSNTTESVEAIESIAGLVDEVSHISTAIAAAVEQQSATANEISRNISSAATGAHEMAQNVQQAAVGANDVSSHIQSVNSSVQEAASGVERTNGSAQGLAQLAADLQKTVGQFKI